MVVKHYFPKHNTTEAILWVSVPLRGNGRETILFISEEITVASFRPLAGKWS